MPKNDAQRRYHEHGRRKRIANTKRSNAVTCDKCKAEIRYGDECLELLDARCISGEYAVRPPPENLRQTKLRGRLCPACRTVLLRTLQLGVGAPERVTVAAADPALAAELPRILRALDTLPGNIQPLCHVEVNRVGKEIRIELMWPHATQGYSFEPATGIAAPLP